MLGQERCKMFLRKKRFGVLIADDARVEFGGGGDVVLCTRRGRYLTEGKKNAPEVWDTG